jgi:histidyl-tRNA synthetase
MVRIKDLRADYTDKDEEKQLDVKLSDLGRVSEVLAAHAAAIGAANKMGGMAV